MTMSFDRFRAHPWHGLSAGAHAPATIDAYIEITPFDATKYEIDKQTGYLRVDRPQGSSALPPTLYGFVPRTWCGDRVAALTPHATVGDKDPLDVCVFSQQRIDRAEIVMSARVVGGIQILDDGEADDKIIAILTSDTVLDYAKDLSKLPKSIVNRLVHYFGTYKMDIMTGDNPIEVIGTYGADHAKEVVRASMEDYREEYGIEDRRQN
ncbi:MAG: inorganic pyrophosphatase [Acidimicrobiales bacterium]